MCFEIRAAFSKSSPAHREDKSNLSLDLGKMKLSINEVLLIQGWQSHKLNFIFLSDKEQIYLDKVAEVIILFNICSYFPKMFLSGTKRTRFSRLIEMLATQRTYRRFKTRPERRGWGTVFRTRREWVSVCMKHNVEPWSFTQFAALNLHMDVHKSPFLLFKLCNLTVNVKQICS